MCHRNRTHSRSITDDKITTDETSIQPELAMGLFGLRNQAAITETTSVLPKNLPNTLDYRQTSRLSLQRPGPAEHPDTPMTTRTAIASLSRCRHAMEPAVEPTTANLCLSTPARSRTIRRVDPLLSDVYLPSSTPKEAGEQVPASGRLLPPTHRTRKWTPKPNCRPPCISSTEPRNTPRALDTRRVQFLNSNILPVCS